MATKKTKPKNPVQDFMELLGVDPQKAGLLLGYELSRQLKTELEMITHTLLMIEEHLLAIRDFHEQKETEKQTEQASSAIATEGPGPDSNAVPDGG